MIEQRLKIRHDFVGFSSCGVLTKIILLMVMFADILRIQLTGS